MTGRRAFAQSVSLVVLASVVALLLSACGGGGGSRSQPVTQPGDEMTITPPDTNSAPVIAQTFEDITLTLDGQTAQWESGALTAYFSDPDSDSLEFEAEVESINVRVIDVTFERPGSHQPVSLIVRAVNTGTATITVTATDSHGLSASQSFTVTVNDGTAPVPDHPDTPDQATVVASGQTVEGSIDSPDDVDYFRLELTEPSVIISTLTADSGLEIAIVDGNGNVLTTAVTASDASVAAGTENPTSWVVRVRSVLESGERVSEGLKKVKRYKAAFKVLPILKDLIRAADLVGAINSIREIVSEIKKEVPNACAAPEEVSRELIGRIVINKIDSIVISAAGTGGALLGGFVGSVVGVGVGGIVGGVAGGEIGLAVGEGLASLVRLAIEPKIEGMINTIRGELRASPCPREIKPLSVSVQQGGEVTIRLTDYIEDPAGRALTFTHGSLPAGFGVTTDGANWTLATQATVEPGDYTITVTATAENSQSAEFDFGVTVEEAGPRQIEGTDLSVSVEQGGEVMLRLTDYIEDPAGGALSFAPNALPVDFGVSLDGATWTISVPADAALGEHNVTVTATNSNDQSTDFLFLVVVTGECRPHPDLYFPQFSSRGIYVGECRDGVPHGQGTLNSGVYVYDGKWREGRPHGQGTSTLYGSVVIRYEGEWREGLHHGQGTRTEYYRTGENNRTGSVRVRTEGEYRDGSIWNGKSFWPVYNWTFTCREGVCTQD